MVFLEAASWCWSAIPGATSGCRRTSVRPRGLDRGGLPDDGGFSLASGTPAAGAGDRRGFGGGSPDGRSRGAATGARAARRAAGGGELEAATLLWLEGHAQSAPEALWRPARERFTALGDNLWVARSCLDLAQLYHPEGTAGKALVTAPEMAALKALGRAATPAGKLARADLDRVKRVLKRFEWQRRSRQALQLAGP